jgi:hypothetical protein
MSKNQCYFGYTISACYSETSISFASALNPIFTCVPSQ